VRRRASLATEAEILRSIKMPPKKKGKGKGKGKKKGKKKDGK
jgi:hypothetical protein